MRELTVHRSFVTTSKSNFADAVFELGDWIYDMDEDLVRIVSCDLRIDGDAHYFTGEYEAAETIGYDCIPQREYVQVQFLDTIFLHGASSKLYTYAAPHHLDIVVGDIVEVPTRYKPSNRAIVRKLVQAKWPYPRDQLPYGTRQVAKVLLSSS